MELKNTLQWKKKCNTEHDRQKEGNKQASLNSYANREVNLTKILKVTKHVSLLIKSSKKKNEISKDYQITDGDKKWAGITEDRNEE